MIKPINNPLLISEGLHYLAHPATTFGNLSDNVNSSIEIQKQLEKEYLISIVNPLTSINTALSWEECMEQCHILLSACKNLILSPGWQFSKGCRQEAEWALNEGKTIYFIEKHMNIFVSIYASAEDIKRKLGEADVYLDTHIDIKNDSNKLYLQYFGQQFIFDKNEYSVTLPDSTILTHYMKTNDYKEEESNSVDIGETPESFIQETGSGINLSMELPEKYHHLLSKDKEYAFFFGKQEQLCLKSVKENLSIYLNKYNAKLLSSILSGSCFKCDSYLYTENTTKVYREFLYYLDNKGRQCLNTHSKDAVHVFYKYSNQSWVIKRGNIEFGLTPLEAHYLCKLIEENL